MSTQKSRDLSILQYYEQLQKEYIVAELRRKIYPSLKDKAYYERIMSQKKAKIDDIGLRNRISSHSIFTNEKYKEYLHSEVYGEKGIPNFIYRDEKIRAQFEESDILNYYSEGSEVRAHNDEGHVILGRILNVNLKSGLVEIRTAEGQIFNFTIENVTRIL